MNTKSWHYIKEDQLEGNMKIAANMTLTLTVNKSGDFVYSDMGNENIWNEFCTLANIEK